MYSVAGSSESLVNFIDQRHQFMGALGWEQLRPPTAAMIRPECINLDKISETTVVLTGANSSGKTTMINRFRERGIDVISEFLRDGYEVGREVFGDYSVSRKCSDIITESALARHVRTLAQFSSTSENRDVLICDRGIGDYIGFLRLIKMLVSPTITKTPLKNLVKDTDVRGVLKEDINFKEIQESCDRQIQTALEWSQHIRYRAVLTLESLPFFEDDGIRSTDKMTTNALAFFVAKAWRDLGYKPILIPPFVDNKDGRADYILRAGLATQEASIA